MLQSFDYLEKYIYKRRLNKEYRALQSGAQEIITTGEESEIKQDLANSNLVASKQWGVLLSTVRSEPDFFSGSAEMSYPVSRSYRTHANETNYVFDTLQKSERPELAPDSSELIEGYLQLNPRKTLKAKFKLTYKGKKSINFRGETIYDPYED